MKQESRFVSELYRYLAPFIDTGNPLYVNLTASRPVSRTTCLRTPTFQAAHPLRGVRDST
jgi:hypothetical protein